jgi:hypothetical protein
MSGDFQLLERIRRLGEDERAIIETLVARIEQGRFTYGPWSVLDGRNNPGEALLEVMDALNYCAAELVRLGKERAQ